MSFGLFHVRPSLVYPTIAKAVCCGGKTLAVDAVLIVAEHGAYPRNNSGQILYPRYEFFPQVVSLIVIPWRRITDAVAR